MDKQIKRVEKDLRTHALGKAKKDVKKLLKMDKKYDKKLHSCGVKVTEK